MPEVPLDIKEKLCNYNWTGNIRELQNVLERAMNMAYGKTLEWKHFADYFFAKETIANRKNNKSESKNITMIKNDLEKELILKAIEEFPNKSKVAESLGISRTMLYKKIKKYGIGM